MMRLPSVIFLALAVPAVALPISLDPQRLSIAAKAPGGVTELVTGITYSARSADNALAFETAGVTKVEALPDGSQRLVFRLNGPAAAQAKVDCTALQVGPGCVRLTWHIAYTGAERAFSGWSDGLRFTFASPPTAARCRPMVKWVKPTGKQPWEVAGDAPYAALDRQLREVRFGGAGRDAPVGRLGDGAPPRLYDGTRLILATNWYDPDWFYNHDLSRVSFMRLGIPAKAPQETTATFEILAPPPADTDSDIAAAAACEPISVSLDTAHVANLFAPGEPLVLAARWANVSAAPVTTSLIWGLYDYRGRRVSAGQEKLSLGAGQAVSRDLAGGVRARPDIYFLAGEVTWPGGNRLLRTTLGVLPQRTAALAPDSPFGVSDIICNPQIYPDQPDLDTVLALCARIGVHWVRSFGFPIRADIKPAEVQAARDRLAAFQKYGLTPHVQCGQTVPKDQAGSDAFRRDFAAALAQFSFVTPYIEVGNELNYSAKPDEFVSRLLKPQFEAMRQADPTGKVMNAGLGGVGKEWWDGFVKVGGLDALDVVSVHPGHHPRAPEFWEGWDGWVFRPQMQRVFSDLDRLGLRGKREVWSTEAYSPSTPERSQLDVRTAADYLVREYCLSITLGVRVIEWYQLQDGTWFSAAPNPTDGEYSYGMVYTDLAPKPQFIAYGVMTAQLEGARCLGRLDLGADDLYGIRFRKADGETVDVLWSYREKHECDLAWWPPEQFKGKHRRPDEPWHERWSKPVSVSLPAGGGFTPTVTDIMGLSKRLAPQDGKLRLELTGTPVYVRGLGDLPLLPAVWPKG